MSDYLGVLIGIVGRFVGGGIAGFGTGLLTPMACV